MRKSCLIISLAVMLLFCLLLIWFWREHNDPRNQDFIRWWKESTQDREALVTVQREACLGVPFILPSDGYIGLLYGDPRGPYSDSNPHQGIEHFGSMVMQGVSAKQIIDILVGVDDLDLDNNMLDALKTLGYEYLGEAGIAGRLAFRKRSR
jgi:hypothetical protein